MDNSQEYTAVDAAALLDTLRGKKQDAWQLVQICVTAKAAEPFDILYSLEKDYRLLNLRVTLPREDTLESVSGLYTFAYLYENEMKDLFGVKIAHMNLDFQGHLYKTAIPTPFAAPQPEGGGQA